MWSEFVQLSYSAMSIVMGLIMFFRDSGAVLYSECLSRMGHFISDTLGHIFFRSKWLDILSDFLFVQNDWNLQKKGKLKDLPIPLYIGAELLKVLNLPDIDTLHYKVRYLSRYVDEEFLFKLVEHMDLEIEMTKINQFVKDQKTLEEKIASIEDENKRLQIKAISKSKQSPSRVIEEFKKFVTFKMMEARDHIHDVEGKALELECMEEGFIRGFLKGFHLVQWKTAAEIEGLTPS
ncbi:hypothetical protein IEQ34_003947 [Dendrobium chrysotoxum]|uniref:Uncharacterized protein n=1 Tax=Dendrobium chrysotoxum TaxID=161865 RepID=A0AAV7GYU8_DENCH|nr:hypothetical protein IEQ34_003947 [Dendrobium chrysotoxum]